MMKIIETNWKWKGYLSNRASTEYIALHHAAAVTCTAAQVHEWHLGNGWSGIGYHFFVRKDGSIYRGRQLDKMGSHVQGKNNSSVGICAEGDYDKEKVLPDAQKCAIEELLRYLKEIYPAAKIVGHREIGASDCPGKYYPIEELKNYEEDVDMEELEKLRQQVDELRQRVDEFTVPKMIYNYIDENMPEWAREGVQWCIDNGIMTGLGLMIGTLNTVL